jgi:uncharacterized protein (TIGR03086 family)
LSRLFKTSSTSAPKVLGMTTGLTTYPLILDAGASFRSIALGAPGASLAGRTPCQQWDLGALVRHLLFYAPILAAAGRHSQPPPGPEAEVSLDKAWAGQLASAMDDVAGAWGDPAAWSGMTAMAGSDPMPAPVIGGMVLGELVVHGWDLAVATGVNPEFSDDVLLGADAAVAQMAELGRGMGVFGPEVTVGADGSLMDQIVARTGRDPGWQRAD